MPSEEMLIGVDYECLEEGPEWLSQASVNDLMGYMEWVQSTAVYPSCTSEEGLEYLSMGLIEEAGEVAGKVKKWLRDDEPGPMSAERKGQIVLELGDVLWYWGESIRLLGVPPEDFFLLVGVQGRIEAEVCYKSGLVGSIRRNCSFASQASLDIGLLLSQEIYPIDKAASRRAALQGLAGVVGAVDAIAFFCGSSLTEVVCASISKLESRAARGTLGGSGDNR